MTFHGSIEDRIEIRELLDTYNDAVNRKDEKTWASTWIDEAEWDFMGQIISGKPAIVETWKSAMGSFSYVGFVAFPGAIEINGQSASARTYVRETIVTNDQNVRRIEGIYEDKIIKTAGSWRFKTRSYRIAYEHSPQQGSEK